MKKMLLILTVACGSFFASAQVSVTGISPAAVVGDYVFEWADPAGGDWACPDFNVGGTFVQGPLRLVETGEPGTNPQGNPISQEGCAPLTNDLTDFIAVIYRNTCEFGAKALNAENAGAIGVIIINRDDEVVPMGGGADGLNVTIPVVMLSSSAGQLITTQMGLGEVVMFLGNKLGLYANDAGSSQSSMMATRVGSMPKFMADNGYSSMIGIEVTNFGSNTNPVTVTAVIDGPSGEVYNETVGPVSMDMGDTLSIFDGNPNSFPQFTMPSYEVGDYTLTYSIDLGVADDAPADNVFSTNFSITEEGSNGGVLSLASSMNGDLVSNTYPSNATTDYKACMVYQSTYPSDITGVEGVYFSVGTDTSVNDLMNAEIFVEIFEWNDPWVDVSGGFAAVTFDNLNQVGAASHFPASEDDNEDVIYQALNTPVILVDNQRYLMCLQTFAPEYYFGYDNDIDYNANYSIYLQPISPVNVDGTWYSGWSGTSAPTIGLKMASNVGLEEFANVSGNAYPNPANDVVTVSVAAQGNANLTITDVSGKTAYQGAIDLATGTADVNVSSLETGMYIFNVKFENGQTSQFNVVKR